MPRALRAVDQLGLDEVQVEDDELAQGLDERERLKEAKGEATRAYKVAHDAAVGLIEARKELEGDTVLRIARWRLSRIESPGRSVSFATSPSSRVKIDLVEAE